MQTKKEIKITAIHEAAHAVMCLENKMPFVKVSIISGENFSGRITHNKEFISKFQDESLLPDSKKFLFFQSYIKCVLAGFVAEKKINSKHRSIHASQDFEHAYEQSGKFFGNTKTITAFVNYMICLVESEFSYFMGADEKEMEDTELWMFVLKLSEELILRKEISYRDCKIIYKCFTNIKS